MHKNTRQACKSFSLFLLLITLFSTDYGFADTDNGWSIISSSYRNSVVRYTDQDLKVKDFTLDCQLPDELVIGIENGSKMEEVNSATVVFMGSPGRALLLIECNQGAHARELSILDPHSQTNEPVHIRTGAYLVKWQLRESELLISYDVPCEEQDCEMSFKLIDYRWQPEK